MSNFSIAFASDYPREHQEAIEKLFKKVSPALKKILGAPVPYEWTMTLARPTAPGAQSQAHVELKERIIPMSPDLTQAQIIHKLVHAWHALQIQYDVIEEGLAIGVTALICKKLGFQDEIQEEYLMTKNMLSMASMSPFSKLYHFLPLNSFRHLILRSAWMAAEEEHPGSIREIVKAYSGLSKPDAFIDAYGKILDEHAPAAANLLNERFFHEHRRLLLTFQNDPRELPMLAMGYIPSTKTIRVAASVKRPVVVTDRSRQSHALFDFPIDVNARLLFRAGPKLVADMKLEVRQGGMNIELKDLPEGVYSVNLLWPDGKIADAVTFALQHQKQA